MPRDVAAETRALPDPTSGGVFTRLIRGFTIPFQALGLMVEHPRLWTFALVPIVITLVLLSVVVGLLGTYNDDLVALIWAKPPEWYWQILWWPLYVLVFALCFVVGALTFPAVVSAPFNDSLSARTERTLTGDYAEEPFNMGRFVGEILSAVGMSLGRLALLYGGLLIIFLFGLIPVVGQILAPVLAPTYTMSWMSAEYLEYAMGRHRFGFSHVFKTVRANYALCLGFGGGIFLLLMVPLMNLLFIPVGVVGGTLLYTRLKQHGALPAPRA
ncbi:MAG: EI24 domain-containing protein [Deltaproteobacteria bacterium]|nr:EI24 domain-containing protein [Deltaproteobacteria bacterium]